MEQHSSSEIPCAKSDENAKPTHSQSGRTNQETGEQSVYTPSHSNLCRLTLPLDGGASIREPSPPLSAPSVPAAMPTHFGCSRRRPDCNGDPAMYRERHDTKSHENKDRDILTIMWLLWCSNMASSAFLILCVGLSGFIRFTDCSLDGAVSSSSPD